MLTPLCFSCFLSRYVPSERTSGLRGLRTLVKGAKEATRARYGQKAASAPAPTKSLRWNVTKGKNLPSHYELENPVQINETQEKVAARLTDCLRDRSIAAQFDDSNAEATCRTFCQTVYMIRLFSAKDPGRTVVEIQRRKGCCLQFRLERKALISAAKGESSQCEKRPNLDIPDFLANQIPAPSDEHIRITLENTAKELSNTSRGRESQMFQLQLLASMTDLKKSHAATCHKIANMIMEGGDIRTICLNMLVSGTSDDLSKMIKLYALLTISNCMDCIDNSSNTNNVVEVDVWFSEQLYPVLLENLKKCECPHGACLISRCLTHLLKNCSGLRDRREQLEPLKDAMAWGRESHKNLYDEARRALQC